MAAVASLPIRRTACVFDPRYAYTSRTEAESFSPNRGIFRIVCDLHDTEKRLTRLLLALDDIHEQRRDGNRGERRNSEYQCKSFSRRFGHQVLLRGVPPFCDN